MASGSWTFTTSNAYIQGKVVWSSVSNGAEANTSSVTVSVYFTRTNTGYYSYGTINTGVQCDSSVYWENNFVITYADAIRYGAWKLTNTYTYKVPHNSNGTKQCYIRATGNSNFGLTFDTNKTVTLDKIPRYTEITKFEIDDTELAHTSVKVNWETSDPVDSICTYLDNSTQWTNNPGDIEDATSGSFTYNGMVEGSTAIPETSTLEPNRTYNLKIAVRRADSGLWAYSDNIQFSTLSVATISNDSVDFDIGSDLTITFDDYSSNKSYLKLDIMNTSGVWEEDVVTVDEVLQTESYTWPLSNYSSILFSKVTTRNEAKIRVKCGTTINGVDYLTSSIEGTMHVVNSNPIFTDFTYGDVDTDTQNVLANSIYMIQGYGDMQAHISTENKALPQNGATVKSYEATIENSSGYIVSMGFLNYSSSVQLNLSFGSINTPGTYTLSICAVDSRGNTSDLVSKTFYVLPYHLPSSEIVFNRVNNFEKETEISISTLYSKLTIGENDVNDSLSIQYRYREASSDTWSSYSNLSIVSGDYDAENYSASYENSSFISLDINNSYAFEFLISDSFQSVTVKRGIEQGIPLMFLSDDGRLTIGDLPETGNDNKLQVSSDISAMDSDGIMRGILATMSSFVSISSSEPINQIVGGLWFEDITDNYTS